MSRLESELLMEIGRALASVDQLEDALTRATEVIVEADAAPVTSAVEEAIAAAEGTPVEVEGDATGVTAAAEEAAADVEGLAPTIEVDADTGAAVDGLEEVTGASEEAAVAADGAGASIGDLGALGSAASGDLSGLQGALEGVGGAAGTAAAAIAAVAAANVAMFSAAVDADSAQRRFDQSTGDLASTILSVDVGGLSGQLDQLALSIGDSDEGVKNAVARLSDLGNAAGATDDSLSSTVERIGALSLRASSLNPALGDTGDLMDRLVTGLSRGGRALVDFGVNLSSADISARALQDTGKEATSDLTLWDKAAAGAALATEQLGSSLGDDFAVGAEGAQNRLNALREKVGETLERLGEPLLDPLLDALSDGTPLVDSLAESFARLGPPLVALLSGGGLPLLGGTITTAAAAAEILAPVLGLVADIVDTIPEPVLGAVGAFLALRRVTSGVDFGASALSKLGSTGPLLALTAAVTAYSVISGENAQREQERAEAVANVDAAMQDATTTQEGYNAAVKAGVEDGGHLDSALGKLGLTTDQFARLAVAAQGDLRNFGAAAEDGAIGHRALSDAVAGFGDLSREEVDALNAQAASMSDYATQAIEAGLATGDFTQRQVDAAVASTQAADGSDNLAAAYEVLNDRRIEATKQAEAERAAYEDTAAAQQEVVDSVLTTSEALGALHQTAPEASAAVRDVATATQTSQEGFLDLALALDDAALSEEQMGLAAQVLGTDVDTLKAFIEGAAGAVQSFADTAAGALPTVADAFAAVGEDGVLSVDEFVFGLNAATGEMDTFQRNLQTLAFAGFSDIAGVIAQQGPEVGGALASELVGALNDGNLEVLESVRASTEAFNQEWEDTTAYLRDVLGPTFILQTGLVGSMASESFGTGLTFAERISIAAGLAKSNLTVEGQAVAVIAATEGADAAKAYGDFLDLPGKTTEKAIAAGLALKADAPTGEAKTAGASTAAAWGSAMNLSGQVAAASVLAGVALATSAPLTAAHDAGYGVGDSFGLGVQAGIAGAIGDVVAAAAKLVRDAEAGARAEAQSESPSRLFARVGADLTAGLAEGLGDTAGVSAATRAAIRAAQAEADKGTLGLRAYADTSLGVLGGRGGGGAVVIQRLTIDVGAHDEPAAAGSAAADAFLERVDEQTIGAAARWHGGRNG